MKSLGQDGGCRHSLRPRSVLMPKARCRRGALRSASITRTRCPALATWKCLLTRTCGTRDKARLDFQSLRYGMGNMSQVVLVTGGAGYIGSHICKMLAEAGAVPV